MDTDFHFQRSDVPTHWRQIADRVESDPLLLQLAMDNIQRWLARGRLHPAPLLEWQRRIREAQSSTGGMTQLLNFLRADNADAEPIKSCSPFPGVFPDTLPA